MSTAKLFQLNQSQAVRPPAEVRFDSSVKRVNIRKRGNERILTPVGQTWDSFFTGSETTSDDFMAHSQQPPLEAREQL